VVIHISAVRTLGPARPTPRAHTKARHSAASG